MLRALVNALAAQTALLKVYVCKVVLKCDGLERACLDALAATNAAHLARLLGYGTLVLVDAAYINPAVQFVLVTQLYDHARAGLDAGTACSALVLIHNGKAGLGIHLDGLELACLDTVAASKASKEAACSTAVHKRCGSTALSAVIDTQTGAVGA